MISKNILYYVFLPIILMILGWLFFLLFDHSDISAIEDISFFMAIILLWPEVVLETLIGYEETSIIMRICAELVGWACVIFLLRMLWKSLSKFQAKRKESRSS